MVQSIVAWCGLFALALLCNGPWSPVVPASTEPLVIVYGKLLPPLGVAAVATLAAVVAELLNWRLYSAALASRRLAGITGSRAATFLARRFAAAPFAATLACASLPLPFWVARCSAIVVGYPRRRFFAALVIGRFGWWSVCAVAGSAAPVGAGWLLGGAAVAAGAWAAVGYLRRTGISDRSKIQPLGHRMPWRTASRCSTPAGVPLLSAQARQRGATSDQ